jgi:hypothetical protein
VVVVCKGRSGFILRGGGRSAMRGRTTDKTPEGSVAVRGVADVIGHVTTAWSASRLGWNDGVWGLLSWSWLSSLIQKVLVH